MISDNTVPCNVCLFPIIQILVFLKDFKENLSVLLLETILCNTNIKEKKKKKFYVAL